MRLIDADALLKFANENFVSDSVAEAEYLISLVPTIDPESLRPTGEWINLTKCANEGVYCSVCRKKVYKADYAWAVKKNKVRSNFCPNCGAKMKGESKCSS